jgi:hypothetical protein
VYTSKQPKFQSETMLTLKKKWIRLQHIIIGSHLFFSFSRRNNGDAGNSIKSWKSLNMPFALDVVSVSPAKDRRAMNSHTRLLDMPGVVELANIFLQASITKWVFHFSFVTRFQFLLSSIIYGYYL